MDRKNEQQELLERFLLETEDAEGADLRDTDDDDAFDALLRLSLSRRAQAAETGRLDEEKTERRKMSHREKRMIAHVNRRLEVQRRQNRRAAFLQCRSMRSLAYVALLVLISASLVVVSVGAVELLASNRPWSECVTYDQGFLSVEVPVSVFRSYPDSIDQRLAPALMPKDCTAKAEGRDNSFSCSFYNGEGKKIAYYTQCVITRGGGFTFSGGAAEVIDVNVKEEYALLLKWSESYMTLMWQDGYYVYAIYGFDLSQDAIMEMAESLAVLE